MLDIRESKDPQKLIVVLGGGLSRERDVSKVSSKAITDALLRLKYDVVLLDVGNDIAQTLSQIRPHAVFNALHGTYGEDGAVQGMLDIMQIPYTHSGLLASAIAFNKNYSKTLWRDAGLNVVPTLNLAKDDEKSFRPYVVKPVSEGSSVGVEAIFPEDNFTLSENDEEYGKKLIEPYIQGRELQVAMLDGKVLGHMEIKPLESRIFDYEAKYTPGKALHIHSPRLEQGLVDLMYEASVIAYQVLNCRGLARLEFLYREEGRAPNTMHRALFEREIADLASAKSDLLAKHKLWFDKLFLLELNTHPGFTPISLCAEMAQARGIEFDELVEMILLNATHD
ncbi:D-alanine--D-alanine ligase [Candidatus Sarmatiella mevalonica]|uniref:D-alanine--D-alanine ligase n=1 Tax=Candidatus Sarmatiella mevalonica TaxID=2770581 RepID=UPI00192209D7|nr:D-alanine--D-alanine ligase [Candidatus Sarmatiella mevalonica]